VRAKLISASITDFAKLGLVSVRTPVAYVLAEHTATRTSDADVIKTRYTLKAVDKGAMNSEELRVRMADEARLAEQLCGRSLFVPTVLTSFETTSHVYHVYPTQLCTTLRALLDAQTNGHFTPITARFCVASIALILEHLHNEVPAHGGVALRDLSPDAFSINESGVLQLIDLRNACTILPQRRSEFVGYVHYQSPETLGGAELGLSSDFWALGALTYEMVTGTSPWLSGEAFHDTHVAVYVRIQAHKPHRLRFPIGVQLDDNLKAFVNATLHPNPDKRLGSGKDGHAALRKHAWFAQAPSLVWADLAEGKVESPFQSAAQERLNAVLDQGYKDDGSEEMVRSTATSTSGFQPDSAQALMIQWQEQAMTKGDYGRARNKKVRLTDNMSQNAADGRKSRMTLTQRASSARLTHSLTKGTRSARLGLARGASDSRLRRGFKRAVVAAKVTSAMAKDARTQHIDAARKSAVPGMPKKADALEESHQQLERVQQMLKSGGSKGHATLIATTFEVKQADALLGQDEGGDAAFQC
jgi:serine/threonine protein kinase